jgi:hypothetical protein
MRGYQMDSTKFLRIAESLRQYQRAELKDFEQEIGANPIDAMYVDLLPNNAVLQTVLSPGTVFLLGRKGTGKSTVFAKAQAEIRKSKDFISLYIDVKSLYELVSTTDVPIVKIEGAKISKSVFQAHMLRKHFLGTVIASLINELKKACESYSIWDRFIGKDKVAQGLIDDLKEIEERVKDTKLSEEEIPILQLISTTSINKQEQEFVSNDKKGIKGIASPINPSFSFEMSNSDIDKTLEDIEYYQDYSNAILRSFPFSEIINRIKDLLDNAGLKKLIVFFDDFSELGIINQKLFVDVILAPLNNSSDEYIKLKIAGYPGRVYYGTIDPSKVHTICLDFASIYKSSDIQTMEFSAYEYTERLLRRRFDAFGEKIEDYFDSSMPTEEYILLIFQISFNVPRLIGSILHTCYLDRISRGHPINQNAIKLAAQKYYETVITQYFNQMNRFALEPFEKKLDRKNQHDLLEGLVNQLRHVRKGIAMGRVGGDYFRDLSNPPTSHFIIEPNLEPFLSSLELNFLVTKYNDMRDKDGREVSVYALFYGLCEEERFNWGSPKGRQYRGYFVQRCFDFNILIKDFLSKIRTIKCNVCGTHFPIEMQGNIEMYKWRCPDCFNGKCEVINLGDSFKREVERFDTNVMLDEVELNILNVLFEEKRPMRASEISSLVDLTYQLIGKRTGKLLEKGLVNKKDIDGHTRNLITQKAKSIYFKK